MTRTLAPAIPAVLLLALACVSARAADEHGVARYSATYEVEYKGRRVGRSEHRVSFDQERDLYRFSSRTTVKGMLRLVNPNPAIEESAFALHGDGLRPFSYRYEDGSRSGEDNLKLTFHWDRNVAVASGPGGEREIALQPGALDRGTLQVQLMRDLAAARPPSRYLLADDEAVSAYEYVANGMEQVRTGLGLLDTVVYVQRREGSSRETWLWLAPSLEYVPVRIEQRREGETRTALLLESVSGVAGR